MLYHKFSSNCHTEPVETPFKAPKTGPPQAQYDNIQL
jgi:hypothetical protein